MRFFSMELPHRRSTMSRCLSPGFGTAKTPAVTTREPHCSSSSSARIVTMPQVSMRRRSRSHSSDETKEQPAGRRSGHSSGGKSKAPGVARHSATLGGTTSASATTAAAGGKDISSLVTDMGAPPVDPPAP